MRALWGLLLFVAPLAAQVVPDRFIVEFDGEPAAVAGPRESRKVLERRAAIREGHRRAIAAAQSMGAEVLATTENVANALLVRYPSEKEAELWNLPGVRRVWRVWTAKLLLDRAAAIHRITDAWSRLPSPDRAGAGVKIGIIDSGIDPDHPAFQDGELARPEGYPLPKDSFPDFLRDKTKIIVARSYEAFVKGSTGNGPRDADGHGTAVAMAAAGEMTAAPLATISGVAPKAWLGIYRVVMDNAGTTSTDAILKALDDAVGDGMDVINLSLGRPFPLRPEADNFTEYMARAEKAGVIVVAAAGNDGPWRNSISSPATVPTVLAAGATSSDRMFATALRIQNSESRYVSFPPSGPWPSKVVTAPMMDAAEVDPSGLVCDPPSPGSFAGKIVLILRGVCFFETKLNNAEAAGAVGAVIYTDEQRPDLMRMAVGSAKLPAQSLSYADGVAVKELLKRQPGTVASLDPGPEWIPLDPSKVASFSSAGPGSDNGIKPDLVAVGTNIYTATQKVDEGGDMYDASGYISTEGTSFSAPIIAGAAAVLKAARPGLTVAQYRSLLINSSTPLLAGGQAMVQRTGAGLLNLDAALRSTIAVIPSSLSFGVVTKPVEAVRVLTVMNTGVSSDTFFLSATANEGAPLPQFSVESFTLDAGASREVSVTFSLATATPGEYQGFLEVRGANTDVVARVPFWCGVRSDVPKFVRVVDAKTTGNAGGLIRNAVIFQVTDATGIGLGDAAPRIVQVSGGGRAAGIYPVDDEIPGGYIADIRLGPLAGDNVFRIEVGEVSASFTIRGQAP